MWIVVDTADSSGGKRETTAAGGALTVAGRSLVVLREVPTE